MTDTWAAGNTDERETEIVLYTPICLSVKTDTWAAGRRETGIVVYTPICLPVKTDTWAAGKRDRENRQIPNPGTCFGRIRILNWICCEHFREYQSNIKLFFKHLLTRVI